MKPSLPNLLKRIIPIAALIVFLVVCFIAIPHKPQPTPGPSVIIDDNVPLAGMTGAYFIALHPDASFEGFSGMSEDMCDYIGYGNVVYGNDIIDDADLVKKSIAKAPDISAFEASGITIEWRYMIKHEQGIIVIGVYTDNGASYVDAEYYLFDSHNSEAAFTNVTPDLAEYVGNGLFYYTEDSFNQVSSVWSSVAREPEYSAPSGKYIEWGSAYAYEGKLIVVGRYVEGSKPAFPNAIKDPDSSVVSGDEEIVDELVDEEIIPEECEHEWTYHSNNDGTHLKVCTNCDEVEEEKCELNSKGICESCGYTKATNQFASISELKKATLKDGDKVSTLGYYSENDGGGSAYQITKSTKLTPDDGVCVKLDNGLYAVIQDTSLISVKNYGLKGDGSKEDLTRLQAILKQGASKVYFPSGTYEFGGSKISLDKMITFVGEGKEKTTIKNLGFTVKYGIELEKIGFDGGASFTLYGAGGIQYPLTGIVNMNLKDTNSEVIYKNCSFKNVGFVSTVTSTGRLKRDYVDGCEFSNISRIAIHHSVNIGTSVYQNNKFSNIGSSDIFAGPVSGIWLGDLTNNTYVESDHVTITNNVLEDLHTADDPVGSNHNLNGNFIAVRAQNATITNNSISRVHGCGADREGLYTKVAHLTISNNTLTDAGYGEGYITCKGHDGPDSFATITDNTINGTAGSGIYLYGPGKIQNNKITCSNGRAAIVCFGRSKETNDQVSIIGNNINFHPDHYYHNGAIVTGFDPSSLVRVENVNLPVIFQGNDINVNGDAGIIRYGVKVFNLKNDLTVTGNTINCAVEKCGAFAVTGNADISSINKDVTLTITNNKLSSPDIAISVMLKNSADVTTSRKYVIRDNEITGVTQSKYGTLVDCGDTNQDSLEYSVNATNTAILGKVYCNVGDVTTTETKLVTQKKR